MFSEMVSIDSLFFNNNKRSELLRVDTAEHPIAVQLFGGTPNRIQGAMQKIYPRNFDIIDFNAGCPVRKVLKSHAGAYLLKDLKLLRNMLAELKKNTDKPVSLKTRIGWDTNSMQIFEVLEIAEEQGIDMLIIHTRTRSGGFSSVPRLDILKKVKRISSIPIIGNGGIDSIEMANRYFEETGVDGIMLGRAALRKPLLFKEIIGGIPVYESVSDVIDLMITQLDSVEREYDNKMALTQAKKFFTHYSSGLPGASKFRSEIYAALSTDMIRNVITKYKKLWNAV